MHRSMHTNTHNPTSLIKILFPLSNSHHVPTWQRRSAAYCIRTVNLFILLIIVGILMDVAQSFIIWLLPPAFFVKSDIFWVWTILQLLFLAKALIRYLWIKPCSSSHMSTSSTPTCPIYYLCQTVVSGPLLDLTAHWADVCVWEYICTVYIHP